MDNARSTPPIVKADWGERCSSSPRPRRGAPPSRPSIYLHGGMIENVELDRHLDYVEYDRRDRGGFSSST